MVKVFDDLDIKIEQFITELERERDRGLGVMMRTLMKYLDEKNIKAIIFQAKYNRGIIDFNRAEEHSYVKGAFTSAWNVDRKSDIANTIIQKNKQAQDKMREKLLYYEESLKKIIHLHTMDKFLGGITRPAMQVITGDKTQDFIDVSKEDVNNLLSQINPILKDIDPTFEMAINFPYKNDLSVIKASSIGREVLSEHKPNWVIEFRKDIVNENIVQKVLAVLTRKS
jgi:predicted N-formylglutamate amidohydrolase